MDKLQELVSQHKFIRNGYRINTDLREENRRKDPSGRTWLRQGPYSNTVRGDHPIVQHVQSMGIPCNAVCINRRRADSITPPMGPHRDGKNTGHSWVAFWGCPTGEGALITEADDRYEEQGVLHSCGDLSAKTHWVEPHSRGTRYSVVCFTGPSVSKSLGKRADSRRGRNERPSHTTKEPSPDGHPERHHSEHTEGLCA